MRLSEHPTSQLATAVYDHCGSLCDRFDLRWFCYDMSFKGGTYSMLTDQAQVFEPYYFHDLDVICSDASGRTIQSGVYTTTLLSQKSGDLRPFDHFKSLFRTEFGIHIVNRGADYDEMISFSFSMAEHEFEYFILNYLPKLKNFVRYFKTQMHREIMQMQKIENRLYLPALLEAKAEDCPVQRLEKTNTQIDLEDGRQVSLSPQQSACLKLLIEGKNIKEVAGELHLSARTVENYLAMIRDKLYCPSLITLLGKYGDQLR